MTVINYPSSCHEIFFTIVIPGNDDFQAGKSTSDVQYKSLYVELKSNEYRNMKKSIQTDLNLQMVWGLLR